MGSAASLGLGFLFGVLVQHPALHSEGPSSGYRLVAVPWTYLLILAKGAEVLVALLAAHLLGGAAAGWVSPPTAASNGAMIAAMTAPFGIGWLLLAVPTFAMLPVVDPVTGSLDLALSSFWISAFSAFFILALLVGYLGGWLGGRLRVSSGGDTAEPDGAPPPRG